MKEILFPYGKGQIALKLEGTERIQVLGGGAEQQADLAQQAALVAQALEHPIGGPSLQELTRDVKKICIITNDNTRPMPSRITIPALTEHFHYPAGHYDITVLIATGLHRAMTEEEKKEQLGEEVCSRFPVICHDAEDPERNVFIGTMKSGSRLYIDKIAAESELIISEGFIEPHFFAGFSGGRKSILPGISAMETIMNNHRVENIASPLATQAQLSGNPIHEECQEAAKMAGLAFILNVALDKDKRITAAFAGDPEQAHLAGTEYVRKQMSVRAELSDIVITSNTGYPLDRNLYQAVKGIDTAAKLVRDGGVIIIAAQCADGIGQESFRRVMLGSSSFEELYEKLFTPPAKRDQWQAQILVKAQKKARVIVVCDTLGEEDLKPLFMEYAPDLNAALRMAYESTGSDPLITLMPEGPCVIPRVNT